MGKHSFKILNLSKKGNIVFSEGKYLGVRSYYNYYVNLYLLEEFYVEVFYHPALNKIDKIEVLEKLKTLDLYIDSMNKIN